MKQWLLWYCIKSFSYFCNIKLWFSICPLFIPETKPSFIFFIRCFDLRYYANDDMQRNLTVWVWWQRRHSPLSIRWIEEAKCGWIICLSISVAWIFLFLALLVETIMTNNYKLKSSSVLRLLSLSLENYSLKGTRWDRLQRYIGSNRTK